ncbi:hypothetical protein M404DRAFT_313173 [Pisolithus tinctorius Marx 270]|uniref:Uncharacterized protein n=1 Tax=Pisolithus tinctorius Marx 270 TaxID=870435 RepID=A0A0C3NIL6_PISTI|nr:hypothetical protein M404DRAFT_313173 [Pisolithus tinctorius Marx 270]
MEEVYIPARKTMPKTQRSTTYKALMPVLCESKRYDQPHATQGQTIPCVVLSAIGIDRTIVCLCTWARYLHTRRSARFVIAWSQPRHGARGCSNAKQHDAVTGFETGKCNTPA